MKKLNIIGLMLLKSILLIAQDQYNPKTFEIIKFKGTIGKYPITMILTLFPDNYISGYYYYDNIGRFIRIEKTNDRNSFKLVAKKFEEFERENSPLENELFEFPDSMIKNKIIIKAQWSNMQKRLPVILYRDTTMLKWNLLRLKAISYFKNIYFNTQTIDFSILYPSINSSPTLNKYFLNKKTISKEMFAFINSTNSRYLLIDQNLGEDTITTDLDGCWSFSSETELVYCSDSILTYRINGFSYCNNGYFSEKFISIRISDQKPFEIKNIFKFNSIDTVLTILKEKYKNILQNPPDPKLPTSGNDAPYFSDYNLNSEVFITPGGIYFRARQYKLANYYDLFLSNREIQKYFNDSFKQIINCP